MSLFLKGNVTIPPRPHTVGGLISWGRAVNRALTELRDRKIVGVTAKMRTRKEMPYPFQISVTDFLLKSAPGLLGEVEIDSQEEENPADAVWSLLAKIIIDSTTGSITSSTVEWVTTVPADTTTDYHLTIANLEILDGQIYTEINGPRQFTYGPISVVVGGGKDSKWMVRML